MKGRFCADNIFILKPLTGKHTVFMHEIQLLLIDYIKALMHLIKKRFGTCFIRRHPASPGNNN
jgi:hypothetical protein